MSTEVTEKEQREIRESILAMEEGAEKQGWDQPPYMVLAFPADPDDPEAGVTVLPMTPGMSAFQFLAMLAKDDLPINPLGMYAAVAPVEVMGVGFISEAWGIHKKDDVPEEEWQEIVKRAHAEGIENLLEHRIEQRLVMVMLQDGTYFQGFRSRGSEFQLKHSSEIDEHLVPPGEGEGMSSSVDLHETLRSLVKLAHDQRAELRGRFEGTL